MINPIAQKQIDYIKQRCEDIKPLVVIHCLTYNHEPYLKDALEGFVMQQTNFPFIAVVHEDASTDGTAKVLKEFAEKYPDIIFPIFEEENQYSKKDGSLSEIYKEYIKITNAKYLAVCEGDDYWIDPLKLQKQVDFLETHHEYKMIYSQAKVLSYKSDQNGSIIGEETKNLEDLLLKNRIPTLTVLLRSDLLLKYYEEIQPQKKGWLMGDYPLWLYVANKSKIILQKHVTGNYRVLRNSASHNVDLEKLILFKINTYKISSYFATSGSSKINKLLKGKLKFWTYILDLYQGNSSINKFEIIKSQKNVRDLLFIILSNFIDRKKILLIIKKHLNN